MKKIIRLIKKYTELDNKISVRYDREVEKYHGMLSAFNKSGKSKVLQNMEAKISKINGEIHALAASDFDGTEVEWDANILSADICLDAWNHDLVFAEIAEAA